MATGEARPEIDDTEAVKAEWLGRRTPSSTRSMAGPGHPDGGLGGSARRSKNAGSGRIEFQSYSWRRTPSKLS